jgi:mannan endo-1,6-alpha-mannosidase
MRWQIFTFNTGYNYKNTAANGGLFNLATRLGAYTGNQTYFDWADKLWTWMYNDVHLIDNDNWSVYDGTDIGDNCTSLDHTLWTYTGGMMIHGAAVMYNITGSDEWKQRTQGLWTAAAKNYFNEGKVMFEVCEATVKCNTDQKSFKAYLARFMAAASKLAPFLYDQMEPYMQASATAATQQCDGGSDGTSCGLQWTKGSQYDGMTGVGQQMAALEIVQSLLIQKSPSTVSAKQGGTSKGDASAGTGGDDSTLSDATTTKIGTSDKAGAGILTALAAIGTLGGAWFLVK